MQTVIEAQDLVVWTQHGTLEEAKSLFAPFASTFQTLPCTTRAALGKTQLSVLYLSSSAEDASVEKALAELRSCKVTALVVYLPHHSTDFAFRVGTMVGRQKFADAEWAFNLQHLKQLLKAKNITALGQRAVDQEASSALLETRERLGLSQVQMASALNVAVRTLQNWEAGKGTGQMSKKMRDLRDLLSRMDDYVIAPKEKEWLRSPLAAFGGRTPQELIAEGRIRDLVIEFDRLREGQPV